MTGNIWHNSHSLCKLKQQLSYGRAYQHHQTSLPDVCQSPIAQLLRGRHSLSFISLKLVLTKRQKYLNTPYFLKRFFKDLFIYLDLFWYASTVLSSLWDRFYIDHDPWEILCAHCWCVNFDNIFCKILHQALQFALKNTFAFIHDRIISNLFPFYIIVPL